MSTTEADAASKQTMHTDSKPSPRNPVDKLIDKVQRVSGLHSDSPTLQDRLFGTFLQQILPSDQAEAVNNAAEPPAPPHERPGFSLALMSTNFRKFNARIGVVFLVQEQLIHLFTWRTTTHTLSLLAIFTLLCLQPQLVPAVPFAMVLFFLMIPTFMARHPPPPRPHFHIDDAALDDALGFADRNTYPDSYSSRPVAPAPNIKPAPETSRDFFRNMRDIQNVMSDFTNAHDAIVSSVSPLTNFSDEKTSSAVLIVLLLLLSLSSVASHLVPWRFVTLAAGWSMIVSSHPSVQAALKDGNMFAELKETYHKILQNVQDMIETELVLDEPPEIRQVETFELQRLVASSSTLQLPRSPVRSAPPSSITPVAPTVNQEYEPWLYTPQPYVPKTPERLSGARPVGTRFLADVQPPAGWVWRDKKWSLDLFTDTDGPSSWVEERCITGVEVEVEGERWVYDIWDVANADTSALQGATTFATKTDRRSWEESNGSGLKGDWRRRRWIRLVERQVMAAT